MYKIQSTGRPDARYLYTPGLGRLQTYVKVSCLIYGPVDDNGMWRTGYNSELYSLYDEPDIIEVVKIGRLQWLGHLFRMQELDPCRKLTLFKPEDTRRVGEPELRWLESVEEDLKNVGMRSWRRQS